MRKSTAAVLLLALTLPAQAVCIVEPLSKQLDDASVVFVATLTEAKIAGPIEPLKNGEPYRIQFGFRVLD